MALVCAPIFAAEPAPGVAKSFDQDLATIEGEIVPLAAEMPATRYSFAPIDGEFKGVRTFGQQVTHVAAVIYAVSAAILGEKNPSEMGTNENGPAAVQSKDEIVKYLKDAFAYAHKAMGSLTEKNLMGMVASPFGSNQVPRMTMATTAVSHSFDHYGQMVVYARMNGMIPPASRR